MNRYIPVLVLLLTTLYGWQPRAVLAVTLGELVSSGGTIVAGDTTFSQFSVLPVFRPGVLNANVEGIVTNGDPGLRLSGGELSLRGTDTGPRVFLQGAPEFTGATAGAPFTSVTLSHQVSERTGLANTTILGSIYQVDSVNQNPKFNDQTLATGVSGDTRDIPLSSSTLTPPPTIFGGTLIITGESRPFSSSMAGSITNTIELSFSRVPVPEPSTLSLVGVAVLPLAWAYRKWLGRDEIASAKLTF
jgi:hypothetical protein